MSIRITLVVALACLVASTQGFAPSTTKPTTATRSSKTTTTLSETAIDTSFMWGRGLNFGKGDFKFYRGFDDMMSVFPDEDRAAYPEVFNLPKGVYEVALPKPLGIIFEEIDAGRGLYVQDMVEDGNAALSGKIQVGDVLIGMTAVKIVGAKYERRMIPARNFDFDTMVGAVSSNVPKWQCNDVVLMFERPGECDSKKVAEFMEFFEPPFDNPWKQQQ
uniref:PDZ domain-containing protein n=1 Tax=Amphora coffeiformis TaxID=265554 RepID=A0A7S3LAF4_9STRA